MTYLINLIEIIQRSGKYFMMEYILLSIAIFLVFMIKTVYNYKNKSTNYKITSTFLNYSGVIIYISLFILGIIYVRYLRWGKTLELIPLYEKFQYFYAKTSFIYLIIFLELILLGIILLIQWKRLFAREMWKRHLYVYHTSYNNTLKRLIARNINPLNISLAKEYSLYNRFVNRLTNSWSWENIIDDIHWYGIIKPYCEKYKLELILKWLHNISIIPLKYGPTFLCILLVIYELFYCNYTLHYIFYYMPFYFIYSLWKTTSLCLSETNTGLNFIIFERLYEEENVLYGNTTDEEEEIIQEYIRRGFRCYLKDLSSVNNPKEWEFMSTFPLVFKYQRRFVKNLQTGMFENLDTGEAFDPRSITIEHIYE